ncbi:SDR family oxidoreductase [Pelagibius litoralis]|uniref:SDR family oxidoreductase n=1 Tax=Pelagibius litoralis TaxID=374515 RepID=A0A967K9E1_9PROT|nr:SDR family oxidoreductase [Pelagibius litoralis]NIA69269.1 SDR family oxidoreductase [Pelagibius litoralis]
MNEVIAALVRIPVGRCGKTGEVSSLIANVLSDDTTYMAGQNLRIDGGLTHAALRGWRTFLNKAPDTRRVPSR